MPNSRVTVESEEYNGLVLTLDEMNEIDRQIQSLIEPAKKDCEAKEGSKNRMVQLKAERNAEFDRLLVESIDEGLASLGEAVKNSVYQHLSDDFGIEKSNIPAMILCFSDIMHKIFGLGANRLEIRFMKNLNSKLEVEFDWPEMKGPCARWFVTEILFTDYVANMRKSYVNMEKVCRPI
jgi:hypothetical protein